MGNSIRSFLQKAGCTDHVLNYLFSTNFEQLLSAIQKSDLEKVKFFHQIKKVSFSEYLPKVKQDDSLLLSPGDSPLHIAVSFQRLEIVKYIVQNVKPLNLEDKNFNGDTPFMIAAMRGNLDIIIYLAEEAHCDVNARENKGSTPFFAACCNGNVEVLEYFLVNLRVDSKVVNSEGQSVVHRVAFYGLIDVLRYLWKNTSLSFSAVDKKGNSPLHLAAMRLNITCMRYLLRHSSKKDALLSQKNLESETPATILVRILNKIKDPSISEITKEEVIKYIEDKKEFPPIQKNEVTSKIRPTLLGTSTKKEKNLENHLKIPINPFHLNPNISPRTIKNNNKRDLVLSKVTPLNTNTEKRSLIPLILGSRNNIPGSKKELSLDNSNKEKENKENKEKESNGEQIEPEDHKENIEDIKSALVQRRNPMRGKKSTQSPEKYPEKIKLENGLSPPNKAGSSPLNKIKQAFLNKFSFLTSPKKKKLPNLNVSKPTNIYTKGLSFNELSEKVSRDEGAFLNEENNNIIKEELNRGRIEGNNNEEEINNPRNVIGANVFSLFNKNLVNKSYFNNEIIIESSSTPINGTYRNDEKIKKKGSIEINIPKDSPFYIINIENDLGKD